MKQQVMIKPDLFEVSTTEYDSAKIAALYSLEQRGLTANKKNLKKRITSLLRYRYENKKHATLKENESISITLKCSITNKEIGYCAIDSYDNFDALTHLYVNKEYRGLNYSKILIQYFEQQSSKVKLIELEKETCEEKINIYKCAGYNYLLDSVYENGIALVKECEIDEITKAFEMENFKKVLNRTIRFTETREKMNNISKHCLTLSDYCDIKQQIVKVLENVKYDLEEFFHFMLMSYEKEHPMAQFIYRSLSVMEEAA
ncbi:GNAT family N-acetyltransferase [Vibrio fluvialis]|nr:GNAT family N-acetyltransferase [Vibrio fluvialis]